MMIILLSPLELELELVYVGKARWNIATPDKGHSNIIQRIINIFLMHVRTFYFHEQLVSIKAFVNLHNNHTNIDLF